MASKKPGFDFAALDTFTGSDAGRPMTVLHPATNQPILRGDGKAVTIFFKGRRSDEFEEALGKIQTKRAERISPPTPADRTAEDVLTAIACTIDWTFDELDGHPFPATPENIRKFWNDRRFQWLLAVANDFIVRDGNFLALNSVSSSDGHAENSSSTGQSLVAAIPSEAPSRRSA